MNEWVVDSHGGDESPSQLIADLLPGIVSVGAHHLFGVYRSLVIANSSVFKWLNSSGTGFFPNNNSNWNSTYITWSDAFRLLAVSDSIRVLVYTRSYIMPDRYMVLYMHRPVQTASYFQCQRCQAGVVW